METWKQVTRLVTSGCSLPELRWEQSSRAGPAITIRRMSTTRPTGILSIAPTPQHTAVITAATDTVTAEPRMARMAERDGALDTTGRREHIRAAQQPTAPTAAEVLPEPTTHIPAHMVPHARVRTRTRNGEAPPSRGGIRPRLDNIIQPLVEPLAPFRRQVGAALSARALPTEIPMRGGLPVVTCMPVEMEMSTGATTEAGRSMTTETGIL